jgi:hypothetical protein
MGKRFKNLDAALKYLRPTGSNNSTTPPVAPAGSQLAEYQEFISRKKIITYTRESSSNPGGIDEAIIKPFSLPTTNTKEFIVDYSKRAKAKLTDAGLSVAVLNQATTSTTAERVYGFTPARAVVSIFGTGDGSPETSKITGAKYKKKKNNSYTFPFGRGGDDPSYSQAKGAIALAVSTGTASRGVSFKPEIYR